MQVNLEVPAKAETAITGYAGAVILLSRGVTYRIECLTSGKLRSATRNGQNIPVSAWPQTVVKRLARTAANYFPPRA